ncbi:FAD-dependent oxidoreductase [Solihabitans fulvus]|uniref:FAD-dependent oxidoreductase n=1 Tax=Solihabitans fulvus TaxID=1892852 RepID=A0A5B2XEI3_9PSEU|nr:FAD/NAD(P)-binding oxidoreductase [Solihabitans fulvus]KAA2262198.1 FAD-dependent oxidoreductase [Solihabitans fulvus]
MNRVVVVGAGPAGMAAARAAAATGVEVVLVDSAQGLGGQYHRRAPESLGGNEIPPIPGVRHLAATTVWALEPVPGGHRLHLRTGPADAPGRQATVLDTAALVLATGAYDRALPFPGWDLPGVFTAGAAQALAKGQKVAVGSRVLLAGTGPFLLPVAESLIGVGARVLGVLEANIPVGGWLRDPLALLAGRAKAAELARYVTMLARHRVPFRPRTTVIAAHGTDRVTEVTTARLTADWRVRPGSERRVPVDAVCVGFGFTPQLELAVAAGCRLAGEFVEVNEAQATSVAGVFAAGEITGIGGADLSEAEGVLAGLAAARLLGGQGETPRRAIAAVRAGRRFAAALDRAHPVRAGWQSWLAEDTLICRCEEVDYGALCRAVRDRDAIGVRSLKLVSRVGLGACQGRTCGRNAADLVGGLDPAGLARRPIAAPVRLGELATTPVHPNERDTS